MSIGSPSIPKARISGENAPPRGRRKMLYLDSFANRRG
jgi:hypothetical protein